MNDDNPLTFAMCVISYILYGITRENTLYILKFSKIRLSNEIKMYREEKNYTAK